MLGCLLSGHHHLRVQTAVNDIDCLHVTRLEDQVKPVRTSEWQKQAAENCTRRTLMLVEALECRGRIDELMEQGRNQ